MELVAKQKPEIEERFSNVNKSTTFLNIVKSHKLDERVVLDIGCSYGEFLVHFGRGSVGLTIAQDEAEYGRVKNLDIRLGNIEQENVPIASVERYGAVFANNILEHLYSPHAFLVKIRDMLKDDGIIIIGVPCIPKIVSLWNLKKFRGSLAVSHINFFTKQSLQKTIERVGWTVIENRSFVFRSKILDWFMNLIAPHFYVVAKKDNDFKYHEKRLKELSGYKNFVN